MLMAMRVIQFVNVKVSKSNNSSLGLESISSLQLYRYIIHKPYGMIYLKVSVFYGSSNCEVTVVMG